METRERVNHRQEGRGYGTERWTGEWVEMDKQVMKRWTSGDGGVNGWVDAMSIDE